MAFQSQTLLYARITILLFYLSQTKNLKDKQSKALFRFGEKGNGDARFTDKRQSHQLICKGLDSSKALLFIYVLKCNEAKEVHGGFLVIINKDRDIYLR